MPNCVNDTGFLLQNLMEHMTDNIYFKDTESRFIMVNKTFCEWTGFSLEQIIGKTDFDLFAEAHAWQAYEDEQRIVAGGDALIGVEEKETWPDGHLTWVSSTKMPLKNADEKIIGTFGISRDITARKEAELKAAAYAAQIQRIMEEMEEDVWMAAELQKTFFPSSYPVFPAGVSPEKSCIEFLHHDRASGVVSGDFCTVRKISDSETGIFICDVMGHGVRAALVTALICTLVEEIVPVEADPGRVLERMNEQLLPILRQDDVFLYATACYMIFDASTGVVRVANAGHPIPLYFQPAEDTATWLGGAESVRGPALAIFEDAEFPTLETQLQPGDAVLAYTDGLYEVENLSEEEFGEDRLLEAAQRMVSHSLGALFPALINEACAFAKDGEFDDDLCMVGFHYKHSMGSS